MMLAAGSTPVAIGHADSKCKIKITLPFP